jgi:hypothetical protein
MGQIGYKAASQKFMTNRTLSQLLSCAMALTIALLLAPAARAQQTQPQGASATTPAAEVPDGDSESKKQDSANQDANNPTNDRIFMVIPNYTTVEALHKYVPLTAKEKFKLGAEDAFDPFAFPLAGVLAGIAQAKNDDAAWGQGWKGFGKRYAAGFGDATIGSFMTTGVFPSVFRQDPRYFREAEGGFWHRSGYAMKRLFVIRSDSNRGQFNISEFGGNATAAAISLTYHSKEERDLSSYTSDLLTQIVIDAISNQLKEFWPDIRRKIFGKN